MQVQAAPDDVKQPLGTTAFQVRSRPPPGINPTTTPLDDIPLCLPSPSLSLSLALSSTMQQTQASGGPKQRPPASTGLLAQTVQGLRAPPYRDVWAAVLFWAHVGAMLYLSLGLGLTYLLQEKRGR